MPPVMLHDFIAANRDRIITRCREKANARSDAPPVPEMIERGVPVLLDQLVGVLRSGLDPGPEISDTALLHGRDLLRAGFSVSEVVHTYGDVCQSVTELAVELNATISAEHFRLLNKCLDDAIASAVTEFGREQGQSAADGTPGPLPQRLQLRNLSAAALVAFEALKTGQVGVAGSTGAALHRHLIDILALADHLVADTLLAQRQISGKH